MRKVRLKDIAKIQAGNSAPASDNFSPEGIPFIRAGSLEFLLRGVEIQKCEKVSSEIAKQEKLRLVKKNSIIFAKSGMSAKMGRVYKLPEDSYVVSHLAIITIDENEAIPDYFKYFLIYRPPFHLIRDDAYPSISLKDIGGLELNLPDLQTQTQIVAALDKAKSLIDKRQKSIELLDKLLRDTFLGQFQQKFNKPDELLELGDVISEGPQNGLYKHSDHYGSGTRILRIDGFYDGVVTGIESLKRLQLNAKEIKTYSLQKDDIVINRVNSREYLGKSAIIPELEEETVFESNMMRFKVDRNLMLPKFLIYTLQQDFIKAQILKRAKDAINQSSINQQDVKSLKVPKCSIQEQELFQTLFDQTTLIRKKYVKSRTVMQELFQSLLQRAFNGDLSFDLDLQLDAFLANEDFAAIAKDDVFIQKLIDRFNQHNQQNGEISRDEKPFKFSSLADYENAKKILFNLIKENKVGHVYDKEAKKTTIEML